jgi:hypothetical protein
MTGDAAVPEPLGGVATRMTGSAGAGPVGKVPRIGCRLGQPGRKGSPNRVPVGPLTGCSTTGPLEGVSGRTTGYRVPGSTGPPSTATELARTRPGTVTPIPSRDSVCGGARPTREDPHPEPGQKPPGTRQPTIGKHRVHRDDEHLKGGGPPRWCKRWGSGHQTGTSDREWLVHGPDQVSSVPASGRSSARIGQPTPRSGSPHRQPSAAAGRRTGVNGLVTWVPARSAVSAGE